ncbi:hypothetical protein TRAPUB_10879 [Trametes pubescens]|uniref:C2H2-type domain-containing protein n=1 Tax=Trametes pubescens TaxID=154538 RepID=A0A1M2VYG7_TRAPU|nr:hypothetical protein TRAPUB_10879 [Trametes pubescens]
MARGRQATDEEVACPKCGTFFNVLGLSSHTRSCGKRRRIEVATRELATHLTATAVAAAATAAATVASGSQEVAAPPEAHPMEVDELRHESIVTNVIVHNPAADDAVYEQLRNRRSTSVEDVPEVDPEDNGTLKAVFVDAPAQSRARDSDRLFLPTFEPPVLRNIPSPLCEDDFLTVHHPRAGRPPTIDHFDDYKPDRPDDPVDLSRLNKTPWEPFKSRIDFEFAEFALGASLNQGQISTLLELVGRIKEEPTAFSLQSHSDLKNAWEAASHVSPGTKLPEGGDALVYSLYADKTRLSSFGSEKGYPIMARIMNLPPELRNSGEYGGMQVVGFLPIVEDEEQEGKPGFTTHKRVVWHEAFERLLKDVARYAKTGYRVKCGDGVLRTLFPIILILVADYEEQTMMALTRGSGGLCPCPICLVPQDQQSILSIQPTHPLRDQTVAEQIVAQKGHITAAALNEQLKPLGLRPVQNVFWKVPGCDVYRALSWDRLHAYHGGLFSDHLFAQFQEIVKLLGRNATEDVNAQYDAIPRWPNLNHFTAVVAVNFTDGTKYEDMSKVIVPASYMVMKKYGSTRGMMLLKCIRRYMVLDMLAGLEVQVKETLQMYATELTRFSQAIMAYQEAFEDKNWSFPKAHTHQHLIDDIVAKGVSKNLNAKLFEHMHGLLKEIYQDRTNFKDVDHQVSQIEHQTCVTKVIRARVNALDRVQAGTGSPKPASVDKFQFNHVHLGSKKGPLTLAQVEQQFAHTPDFARFRLRLEEYLNKTHPGAPNRAWQRLKAEMEVIEARYIKVDYESVVTWRALTDHLRCSPMFQGAPRYDHIIYQIDDNTIGFAQLKFVFVCTFQGTQYPVALVKPYNIIRNRRNMDRDLGLCRVHPCPTTEFVPVECILRGALIVKDVEENSPNFLVIDTVDGDMFLRLRKKVSVWNT